MLMILISYKELVFGRIVFICEHKAVLNYAALAVIQQSVHGLIWPGCDRTPTRQRLK